MYMTRLWWFYFWRLHCVYQTHYSPRTHLIVDIYLSLYTRKFYILRQICTRAEGPPTPYPPPSWMCLPQVQCYQIMLVIAWDKLKCHYTLYLCFTLLGCTCFHQWKTKISRPSGKTEFLGLRAQNAPIPVPPHHEVWYPVEILIPHAFCVLLFHPLFVPAAALGLIACRDICRSVSAAGSTPASKFFENGQSV